MVYLGAPATHVTSTCLSPSGMLDKVAINFSLLVVLSSSNKLENFGKEISEGYSLICDKTSSYGWGLPLGCIDCPNTIPMDDCNKTWGYVCHGGRPEHRPRLDGTSTIDWVVPVGYTCIIDCGGGTCTCTTFYHCNVWSWAGGWGYFTPESCITSCRWDDAYFWVTPGVPSPPGLRSCRRTMSSCTSSDGSTTSVLSIKLYPVP